MTYTVVTGAAGFVGSKLIEALNRIGVAEIVAVDDLRNSDKVRNLAKLEIQDYLDKRDFLTRLTTGHFDGAIELILHQGACTNTMETDGRFMMENNYEYSKALLDWCQDEEVALIYASSASVYGAGRKFAELRDNKTAVEADVHLIADLIALRSAMPEKTKDTARQVVAKVVKPYSDNVSRVGNALRLRSDRTRKFQQFEA